MQSFNTYLFSAQPSSVHPKHSWQTPQGLEDIPLSTLAGSSGAQQTGGIVVSHASPPVPLKLASKIWSGEFVDLSMLLPYKGTRAFSGRSVAQ